MGGKPDIASRVAAGRTCGLIGTVLDIAHHLEDFPQSAKLQIGQVNRFRVEREEILVAGELIADSLVRGSPKSSAGCVNYWAYEVKRYL